MKHNTLLRATYIFLAFLTVAVSVSCSKDDDKEPASGDGIEGTWQLASFSYDGDFVALDESIPVTIVGKDINNVRVTFKSDGTYTSNGTSFTFVITSKEDPSQVLELPAVMFEENGTWEKEGNSLYVTEFLSDDERTGIPITELNATTLRLSGSMVDEDTDAIATVDIRFTRSN